MRMVSLRSRTGRVSKIAKFFEDPSSVCRLADAGERKNPPGRTMSQFLDANVKYIVVAAFAI